MVFYSSHEGGRGKRNHEVGKKSLKRQIRGRKKKKKREEERRREKREKKREKREKRERDGDDERARR